MKATKVVQWAAVLILLGLSAWAQEFPRFELSADYSFARFNPNAAYTQDHSLNGGGGSITININDFLGFKADFKGYQSTTNGFTIPAGLSFPGGASGNASGDLFTYMFGPQMKVRSHGISPFAHLLFGAAHSNVYSNAFKQICPPVAGNCSFKTSPANDAFAMAFGIGVDIPFGKTISFRPAEVDYLLTRFTNQFANSNQNNLRYSVGLLFSFGHTTD
jgi:outer membrane protein with beta-barrel domain